MKTSVQSIPQAEEDRETGSDFLHFLAFLLRNRYWLMLGTASGVAIGLIYASVATSVYKSWAIVAPKESQGAGMGQGLLSQLGGLGNLVSSQLSTGQMTMDRMEVILKSRDLAESVLVSHDLLPRLFPERWDAQKKEWKREKPAPTVRSGVELLVRNVIYSRIDLRRKVLEVGAMAPDSLLAAELARIFVTALNEKIKWMIEKDAVANQAYLENQLSRSSDPLLREKIQQLIAMEIEKSMLVGSQSFYVLESPFTPRFRHSPNKKKILAVSAFCGLFLSIMLVAGAGALASLPAHKGGSRL